MKSMHLAAVGPPIALRLQEDSIPEPGKSEVLVRVHAAGIIPSEIAWYPTAHTRDGQKRQEAVLSHEFAGEIARAGEGVKGIAPGEAVYGMNDWFADGALAEYCIAEADAIAAKPQTLSMIEAASVPISALTAMQGLIDRAKLQTGEHVLVHGGAGAVGSFAVQLARLYGATVTATAAAKDIDFVKALGADEVLDYRADPFEKVRDIDVVFDAVGGETLKRSWGVLSAEGRLVTIAADSEGTSDERTKKAFFIVEPSRKGLLEVAKMIDAGDLRTVVGGVIPLFEAGAAYATAASRQRGKTVVTLV